MFHIRKKSAFNPKYIIDILLMLTEIYLSFTNTHEALRRKTVVKLGSKGLTLFKTDSMRAGCFACQNKNPRTIRWKISFSGFTIAFCNSVSSDSLDLLFTFPNCPAEFSSATPTTCSGNPAAATKAVKPPRLKNITMIYIIIICHDILKKIIIVPLKTKGKLNFSILNYHPYYT